MSRRAGLNIAERALPPEKRPRPAPEPFTDVLPSGLIAKWRMPDPFAIIAFDGVLPDQLTGSVIDLLKQEKSYQADADPRRYLNDAAAIKGMYMLAGAMLVEPKLDPRVEYGEGETLGRREIGIMDVARLYLLFRLSTRIPALDAPAGDEPGGAQDAARDSE